MENTSGYSSFWTAIAGVGSAVWLVTFAIIGLATASSEMLRNALQRTTARFSLYYGAMLTSANIVAVILTALHWIAPPGGRYYVDGGVIVGELLAWGLVALTVIGYAVRLRRSKGWLRSAFILTLLLVMEVFLSTRSLFGSEEWAATGVISQLAVGLGTPMLVIAIFALRREFPSFVAYLERNEPPDDDDRPRLFIA